MSEQLPVPPAVSDLVADTPVLLQYIRALGLPIDNVIASSAQRKVVGDNLPAFISGIGNEEKREARYLSKFVGATAIGLFDAALNYVWNEVILNLRKKICVYGVELFYDAAVGGANRANYNDESDLEGIKDIVLLNTCLKLELVSDVVHTKLTHILTMRNDLAASHPNVAAIGGFELLGWLETCVVEVLQDRPSDSAIHIKSLVENIKSRQDRLDETTAKRFSEEARNLSLPHVGNLLITLFGIYVSQASDQNLRANVISLAPVVWECAEESRRFQIGTTIDRYRTNLDQDKLRLGTEFLDSVAGRSYETIPAKTVLLDELAEKLEETHDAYDNFHHEPTVMREIMRFCKKASDIPKAVRPKLVRVVMRCRLGNGRNYREGVSPAGVPLYDSFLSMLDDEGIVDCVLSLFRGEIKVQIAGAQGQTHLAIVLGELKGAAVADRLKQVLDYLMSDIPRAYSADRKKDFRDLSSTYITWP